jgi:Na+/serine symporter
LCLAKEIKNKKKIQKIHYNKFLILIILGTVSAGFNIVLRCA